MFRGLYTVNLDHKGRLAVPKRFREVLFEQDQAWLVVTIDTECRCLLFYPYNEWECIEQKLLSLPSFDPVARRIQRLLMGHATEVEMDRQGRILLPAVLRNYAGLDTTVMMVGQGNKCEIWGAAQWQLNREAWLAEDFRNSEQSARVLNDLAI